MIRKRAVKDTVNPPGQVRFGTLQQEIEEYRKAFDADKKDREDAKRLREIADLIESEWNECPDSNWLREFAKRLDK